MNGYRAIRWFLMIPPWIFCNLLKPYLRPDHPWHKRRLTLRSWVDYGTEFSMDFGFVIWMALEMMAYLVWIIAQQK